MSAYVVDKAHVDTMVQAGLTYGRHSKLAWYHDHEPTEDDYPNGRTRTNTRHELIHESADRVGAMLWNTNRTSVDYRYAETMAPSDREPYHWRHSDRLPMSPVAVLKAIDGYEYQACEHAEWETSEAHAFCQALRRTMIHALPGYDAADWTITDPAPRSRGSRA